MTQLEETQWLLSILGDLKTYQDHNCKTLDKYISIMKYDAESLEKQYIHKYLSNERNDSINEC